MTYANIAKVESGKLITEMVDVDEILDNIEWSLESKIKFNRSNHSKGF
ncbi:MAG: hypothetical protein WKF59_04160 [Chitinophagaceae bacterium]